MTKPFRFGLQAYSSSSPSDWRELAKKTEDLGFSSFHLADHYIGEGPALKLRIIPCKIWQLFQR